MPVGFHQQQRFAIQGQANLREILNAMDRGSIQKFQRAGHDFGRDNVRYGLCCLVHLRERGDESLFG